MTTLEPSLTVDEVCLILKECARTGVSELTFRNLQLSRGATAQEIADAYTPPAAEMALVTPDHEKMNEQALAQAQDDLRREQMSFLSLEDPVAYERALTDGDLEDDDSSITEQDP